MTTLSTDTEHRPTLAAAESVTRPHPPDPADPPARIRVFLSRLRPRGSSLRNARGLLPRDAALHQGDPHLKYHLFARQLR